MRKTALVLGLGLGLGLVAGCGDGSGGEPSATVTREALAGIWVEPDGTGYQAFELELRDPPFADRMVRYEGTGAVDPRRVSRHTILINGRFVALYDEDNPAVEPAYLKVTALSTTSLTLESSGVAHTYQKMDACPMTPRDGAWFWSAALNGAGSIDIAVGPRGPAMTIGAGVAPFEPALSVTFAQRLGCGFTETAMPYNFGKADTRLVYGPDGQPRIAAVDGGAGPLSLARFDAATDEWVYTQIDTSDANGGYPPGLAVADDGAAWLSHLYLADAAPWGVSRLGVAVSRVGLDGTVKRWELLAQSDRLSTRIALDGAGAAHVVSAGLNRVQVRAPAGPETWSVVYEMAELDQPMVTGFVLSTSGAYHIMWSIWVEGHLEQRYTTNASGTWETMSLGPGRGGDVELDSTGAVVMAFVREPDQEPYLVTNRSGAWVTTKIETPGAPGLPAPQTSPNFGNTVLAIDKDDHIYVGFGTSSFATDAY